MKQINGREVKSIQKWAYVYFVQFVSGRPSFVSFKSFLGDNQMEFTQEVINLAQAVCIDDCGSPCVYDEDDDMVEIMSDNYCEDGLIVRHDGKEIIIGEPMEDTVITSLIGDVVPNLSDSELSAIDSFVADRSGEFEEIVTYVDNSHIDPSNMKQHISTKKIVTYVNKSTGKEFNYLPESVSKDDLIAKEVEDKRHTLACKQLKCLWVQQNLEAVQAAVS